MVDSPQNFWMSETRNLHLSAMMESLYSPCCQGTLQYVQQITSTAINVTSLSLNLLCGCDLIAVMNVQSSEVDDEIMVAIENLHALAIQEVVEGRIVTCG